MKYRKIINKILVVLVVSGVAGLAIAANYPGEKTGEFKQSPKNFVVVADTATTTKNIATQYTHFWGAEYESQGACIKIKDSDGIGYTYLTVNNGQGFFTSTSCE